ncbi:hypothetical protein NN761_05135 [Bacteroides clarus]|uniref:hypothetical protein n=1 Tax=Bacteroides clarus TaxID=626929 RepID=UPI0021007348|nr:hypothetical protein [Bacteroides clarus]MCQ1544955.1 hypothetical protein [Bacteroides clarus]
MVKQRYCKEEARPTGERCRRLPGYADVSRTGALHTRSFTPHPFHHFSPASETEAYCILITNVNYREGSMTLYGRTITCPCGDSIKSLDTWARLFRWSKTRVRRFFLNLQKLQLIKYSIDHSLAHIHVVDFLPGRTVRPLLAGISRPHPLTQAEHRAHRREWLRLSSEERNMAIEQIPYYEGLANIRYYKQAISYLADKYSLDEEDGY